MYLNEANEEYPHVITVNRTERIVDDSSYPPKEVVNTTTHKLNAFMDTPNSSQQINYHNLDIRLDRVLYVPFGSDIQKSDSLYFRGTKYEIVGDIQNQGGQDLVVSIPVRRE